MRSKKVQIMVETAVLVGAALLLSELRLFRATAGRECGLGMLPIFVLAFTGAEAQLRSWAGLWSGCSRLSWGGYYVHPVQILLDYPASYMVLAVAGFGLFKKVRWLGVTAGTLLRLIVHVISGAVFFAE
jgi:thiamine transporter